MYLYVCTINSEIKVRIWETINRRKELFEFSL